MVTETAFHSEQTFTQDEFWDWLQELPEADQDRHWELLRGHIVLTPPGKWKHGTLGARLTARLVHHVDARRLGIVFDASMGYDLASGDTVQPDVSFVDYERFRNAPRRDEERGFLHASPDLVVEILSRSTAKRDRTEKAEIYAENGIDESTGSSTRSDVRW